MSKHKTLTWSPETRKTFKYAHVKRDGYFLNVIRSTGDGKCFAFTSKPRNILPQLQFLLPLIERLRTMPLGTSLYGELWLPGHPASAVTTAINSENPELRFDVFAIANWPRVATYEIDAMPLERCAEIAYNLGFNFLPYMTQITDPRKLLQGLLRDEEGFVLKNANLLDWHKLKPRKTIDLIVTGYTPGDGKYANLIGSINCSTLEGYEVASVSGMTDTQRRSISEHSEWHIGRVIEVEYQSVGNGGRLRHPTFVRLRDDKDVAGCSVAQDADLQKWFGSQLF